MMKAGKTRVVLGVLFAFCWGTALAEDEVREDAEVTADAGADRGGVPVLPDFGLDPAPENIVVPDLGVLLLRRAGVETRRFPPDHASGLVIVSGLPELDSPRFRRRAAMFLDRPFTYDDLTILRSEIERIYLRNRRPGVEVAVVPEETTETRLVLEVRPARVNEVRVTGNRWFRRAIITSKSRHVSGDEVDSVMLREDLDWMNRNPFRRVEARLDPSEEPGEVDLVYEVKDRFPFRVYAGFENSGNRVLGEERFVAGFNWGHLMAMDHELHYAFSAGRYWDRIFTHSASYVAPLPGRHELSLFGHYSDVDVETNALPMDLEGENLEVGLRYTMFLVGWESPSLGLNYAHELSLGGDFKRAETAAEYGLAQRFDPATEIIQGVAGYTGTLNDPLGWTRVSGRLIYSPGNFLSDRNRDRVFEEARAGAQTDYLYFRAGIERETELDDGFTLLKRAAYQDTNGRMLPSEQFGVGGYDSVRGYEERAAAGDRGYFFSAELRTPEFNFNELFGVGRPGRDRWQLLGFVDYGMAETKDPVAGEFRRANLMGAGPGIRMRVDDQLAVRFDYGWQLRDDVVPGDTRDHRVHAAIFLAY